MYEVGGCRFDAGDLEVQIATDFHAVKLDDPFYRYAQRWHGSLIASPLGSGTVLGHADAMRLRVSELETAGLDPWEVLDAEEGDLEMVGEVFLDRAGWREELEDDLVAWEPD